MKNNRTAHVTPEQGASPPSPGLGTFTGVFTPSILTILGIILFLRLGYVTGSAGVSGALLIVAVANVVTIITSQSLSAVATNLRVKGGGDYYLISRTLGYKFGGSIGIVLYLAQSVSVAFYSIGFAEALAVLLPISVPPPVIAALAVSALFILAWLGADWATKFQFVVMILLIGALASFYLGGIARWQQSIFLANWLPPENSPSFWIIFALFFPAVTGFTQGVSMSGDLKNAGKSLPMGTFAAVAVSIMVYLSVIIVFAGVLSNRVLVEDYQAMQKVARWGFLIDAGVIAATLSSAMASFMGGPRILQSLAGDKIFPFLTFFAKGAEGTNNPRRGVVLTAIIAFATISLGQLNLIAQVVSMFFLISYGLLNYATYYEADTESTSFRPRFRFFHKYVSLFGALLCLAILLALDVENGVVSLLIMLAVYLYLNHRKRPARWADSSRSHSFSRIRKGLQQMAESPEHQRDWHPHFIAFTKSRENRQKLLQFGDLLCGDVGLMSALQVLPEESRMIMRVRAEKIKELEEDIGRGNLFCYPKVVTAEDFSSSLPLLLQSYGYGPLQGNCVLTNWYNLPDTHLPGLELLKFGHNLRIAYRHGYNLVIFHCETSQWEKLTRPGTNRRRIDVWWQKKSDSSKLMLLFAYLVKRDRMWRDAVIRVLSSHEEFDFTAEKERLEQIFEDARIDAELQLVPDMSPDTVIDFSRESSLVFLPFKIVNSRVTDISGFNPERFIKQLNATAMVMAAEEIDLDAEPEEGAAGELAQAMDELAETDKQLRRLERDEQRLEVRIGKVREKMVTEAEKLGDELTSEKLEQLQRELFEDEQHREKLFRKTAKVKARRDDIIKKVEEYGEFAEEEK